MVSMSVNIRTKVRKTQRIEFFCKILFFATDKIRPRRTPVRLSGGYLPVLTIFSYPLRGCKETEFLYTPLGIVDLYEGYKTCKQNSGSGGGTRR